jgi:hypothetical protein
MVSRKAKKDHPWHQGWRQGYQGIRPNHSHPVISPLVGMRTPTIQQQQKGTFLLSSFDRRTRRSTKSCAGKWGYAKLGEQKTTTTGVPLMSALGEEGPC